MRTTRLTIAATTAALLLAACGSASTPSASRPTATDEWSAYAATLDDFSGVVAVARGDQLILEKAYGSASPGHPNTPSTLFCIASMGKMLTGVAVAQLAEGGRLSLEAPVSRYLKDFPAWAERITVRQLLDHTSGLGDAGLGGEGATPPSDLAGLLNRIRAESLRFEPGSRFAYSNDGFIVAGAIIEAVSGQSYEEYVQQHILDPAGMTATRFGAYRPARIAGMAHPYTESDGVLTDVSERVQLANPSGGAISTAADMLHFAHALLGHELLSPEMTGTVMTGTARTDRPGPRSVGESYGLGFVDATHSGVRIVGHNGGTPGYEAQLDIYPDQDTAVVALSNRDGIVSDVIRGSESVMVKEVTGTTGTRGPAATGGAAGSKATEYSRCMRRNGVSGFPTPGADGRIQLRPGSGPDPGSTAFKTAEKACEALAPPRVGG